MFIACDLIGLYRSTNAGSTWTMMDTRQVTGSDRFSVAFDPTTSGHVVAMHRQQGLKESFDNGATWACFNIQQGVCPPGPTFQQNEVVTAAGFSLASGRLHLGTNKGVWTFANGVWSTTRTLNGDGFEEPVMVDGISYGTANAREAIRFVSVMDPVTGPADFAATLKDVWMYTAPTWTSIGGSITAVRPPALFQPIYGNTDHPPQPWTYNASRIRGFAGGYDATRYVLYVTITTDQSSPPDNLGGVYRYDRATSTWTRQVNGLGWQPGPGCGSNFALPIYERLGVARTFPDTAYVSVVQTTCSPDVYRGTFSTQMTWQGIYNGYQRLPDHNLDAGWIEIPNATDAGQGGVGWGFDWGFGGSARGLTVDPSNQDTVVFTNFTSVHITFNGTNNYPPGPQWAQYYTQLKAGTIQDPPNARWSTAGVDVTNTPDYVIHPADGGIHFILNNDVGLLRSSDSGNTWYRVAGEFPGVQGYNNFYQLAFQTDGPLMWAAASKQHDIPTIRSSIRPPERARFWKAATLA